MLPTLRALYLFVSALSSCLPLTSCMAAPRQNAPQAAKAAIVARFNQPFLFTYGSWDKRAKMEDGRVVLRGDGLTPQGGGGGNLPLDLHSATTLCPTLRVRVGANNKMTVLRLLLRDDKEQVGTWNFTLPAPGTRAAVIPQEGAALADANSLEKSNKPLDLAHIIQWQLVGDWSSAPTVDLEVEAIGLTAPDAAALQLRQAKLKARQDAQDKLSQEHEAMQAKYLPGTPASPNVIETGTAAPDILTLTIEAGKLTPSRLAPYQPQSGDEKRPHDKQVILVRGGEETGWLIGAKRDTLVTYERIEGDPLLEWIADRPETYVIHSQDDPAFAQDTRPTQVWRKSKPTDWAQPSRGFVLRHTLYLKLPHVLTPGKTYTVAYKGLNTRSEAVSFRWEADKERSEAVHVNQVGFRPDDPIKRAYLSLWAGTGGPLTYPDGLKFSVLDEATGKAAFTGQIKLVKSATETEAMADTRNFNGTNVYRLDFDGLTTPGRYRVYVEGVGCSYVFPIERNVWQTALNVQMQGLYNERSGMELGPPYTKFKKPRDLHPADGQKVTQSTYSVLEKGGEAYDDLAKGDTGQLISNAWGGYHDAGDWNPRRVTHMKVTHAQLELLELFPQTLSTLKLNIPHTSGVPDLLTEARWEVDCFRRLQKPDGGVPFGIETQGDPIDGEVSFNQSMPEYVFAPDLWSSYYYAGVAVRLSRLLAPYDAAGAKVYRDSGLKAMQWAQTQWVKRKTEGTLDKIPWDARDDRNFAALQCYATTGDKQWHDVFLENTCLTDPAKPVFQYGDHVQRDAAFAYTQLPDSKSDASIKANARKAVLSEADKALEYAGGNAFGLTTPDRGKPLFIGFYTGPDATECARAHVLTHDTKYLSGVLQACQFSLGANPSNLVYTTGLGSNPIRHPLHLDSRRTGQPAPPGLTTYGNIDLTRWHDNFTTWPITYYLQANTTPSPYEWPTTENYFDLFLYPAMDEFTVDRWAPTVYEWGYLAARK